MIRIIPLAAALLLTACAGGPMSPVTSLPPPSTAEVADAQQRLRALGMYQGPVDGIWGNETQLAVERYQRSRGLNATARLDERTQSTLRADETARRTQESLRQAREAERRAQLARPIAITEATDVRTLQNRLRQLNHYNGPADGVWGQRTQQALESFQRAKNLPVGQVTAQTLSALDLDPKSFASRPTPRSTRIASAALVARPLDPAVVRGVQQRLRLDGFDPGVPDGVWGPRTQSALERFQRSRGLDTTGQLDPMTATALGMDPNNLTQSTR